MELDELVLKLEKANKRIKALEEWRKDVTFRGGDENALAGLQNDEEHFDVKILAVTPGNKILRRLSDGKIAAVANSRWRANEVLQGHEYESLTVWTGLEWEDPETVIVGENKRTKYDLWVKDAEGTSHRIPKNLIISIEKHGENLLKISTNPYHVRDVVSYPEMKA